MEKPVPDETTIRDYLLGRLDADPELVERMDEQMLTDAGFSEVVDVIEDEIIEEYLEGTLNSDDSQAVERHFLRPPERQRKLQTARLLNRHLVSAAGDFGDAPEATVRRSPLNVPPPGRLRSHLRMYIEIAAGVLIVVSALYLVQLRHALQTEDQKLAQERQRSEDQALQLSQARDLAQPATVLFSLLQPGIQRGDAALPELKIGPGTKKVHVEVALPFASSGSYDLRLEGPGGKTVWTQSRQWPFSSQGMSLLILDLPATALDAGDYRLIASRGSGSTNELAYSFHVWTP